MAWATARGIPCSTGSQAELQLPACDFLISMANDRILRPADLAVARSGAFNCHNSLLPDFRGAYAASWALLTDQRVHGASWHRMTARIDDGPLAVQASLAIAPGDTAQALNRRSLALGVELLKDRLLPAMAAGLVPEIGLPPCPYYPVRRRAPGLGLVPWDQGSSAAMRHFRALDRGPIDNSFDLPKLLIGTAAYLIGDLSVATGIQLEPGSVEILDDQSCLVGTIDTALRVSGLHAPRQWRAGGPAAGLALSQASLPTTPQRDQLVQLGELIAAQENSVIRVWCTAEPARAAPKRFVRTFRAGDWDWLATHLLSATSQWLGRRIMLSTPGMQHQAGAAKTPGLFQAARPFVLPAESDCRILAQAMAGGDHHMPMLIDALDRRSALRDANTATSALIAITAQSADQWSVEIS